jgi:hypothetical protein
MTNLSETVAIVRSFNNDGIVSTVQNLTGFLGHVIVVVNNERDNGSTRAWLAGMRNVTLIEINQGYTWSNGLNMGLRKVIQELNVDRIVPYRYIFNVSVEARFTKQHVSKMLAVFDQEAVGVVGTSFDARQKGNRVSLGISYQHPRNTGMIIDLEVFNDPMLQMGFDPFCDGVGGMEDIDFIYRLAAFTDLRTKMLDLQVPLIVGVNYNQETKERDEREAMRTIFNRYRVWQERFQRVHQTAESMGLLKDQ